MNKENMIILYKDENGKGSVNVRFANEDVWLSNNLNADIYSTTRQDFDHLIANINKDDEQHKEVTCKKKL